MCPDPSLEPGISGGGLIDAFWPNLYLKQSTSLRLTPHSPCMWVCKVLRNGTHCHIYFDVALGVLIQSEGVWEITCFQHAGISGKVFFLPIRTLNSTANSCRCLYLLLWIESYFIRIRRAQRAVSPFQSMLIVPHESPPFELVVHSFSGVSGFGRTRMWCLETGRKTPEAANSWDDEDDPFHGSWKKMAGVLHENDLLWAYFFESNDSTLMDVNYNVLMDLLWYY